MPVLSYTTSTDYQRLYELARMGHVLVGFARGYGSSTLIDVVKITARKATAGYIIGCRGIEYGGTHNDNAAAFSEECGQLRLEWIDPYPGASGSSNAS